MPRRSGKIYRDIGITPAHNRWLEEQAGGPRGVSEIVNKCIARTMRHSDALDRMDLLNQDVTKLAGALESVDQRIDRLTRFIEFQTWLAVGENADRFDAWMDKFEQFAKEDETNASE